MRVLTEKQAGVLVDVRSHGTTYEKRGKASLEALERKGLIEPNRSGTQRAYLLTDAGLEALPEHLPRTHEPVYGYWLYGATPDMGPHQHDTVNGYVYRFLRVVDGVPHTVGYELESRFQGSEHAQAWSWGLKGLKVKNMFKAETIAKDVLGDDFKGWVK